MNTQTTAPRWFAHWWDAQQDRHDPIGGYADEVEAEDYIPFRPTLLCEITDGLPEHFANLIEYAWFEWEYETCQSPFG